MLPLNDELESCKKIDRAHKRGKRGNAFVGDDFMAL